MWATWRISHRRGGTKLTIQCRSIHITDPAEQPLPHFCRSALSQPCFGYCHQLLSYRLSVGWANDPSCPNCLAANHTGPLFSCPTLPTNLAPGDMWGSTPPGSPILGVPPAVCQTASTTDRLWLLSSLTLSPFTVLVGPLHLHLLPHLIRGPEVDPSSTTQQQVHSYAIRAEIIPSPQGHKKIKFFQKKNSGKERQWLILQFKTSFIKFWWKLTQLLEFIIRCNIIIILHKNNNNQGVFLELLVAAKNAQLSVIRPDTNMISSQIPDNWVTNRILNSEKWAG